MDKNVKVKNVVPEHDLLKDSLPQIRAKLEIYKQLTEHYNGFLTSYQCTGCCESHRQGEDLLLLYQ